jgi:hypothetical protein
MTEPIEPKTPDEPTADETFTWTGDAASQDRSSGSTHDTVGATGSSSPGATATALLESLREAVDDLAERASPTVREFSARAAELAATAADRAAPLAKRSGEVTADASGKLAAKSRTWASDLRASLETADGDAPGGGATDTTGPAATTTPTPPPTRDAGPGPSDGATPA